MHGTFEKEDVPCDPNCVRMQFFKISKCEQKGDDIHAVECWSMDLQGYFPKSMMNKISAAILLDQAKISNQIFRQI